VPAPVSFVSEDDEEFGSKPGYGGYDRDRGGDAAQGGATQGWKDSGRGGKQDKVFDVTAGRRRPVVFERGRRPGRPRLPQVSGFSRGTPSAPPCVRGRCHLTASPVRDAPVSRPAELARNLAANKRQDRRAKAGGGTGSGSAEITLIAVTKDVPPRRAGPGRLGLADFGEEPRPGSRRPKGQPPYPSAGQPVTWHFIGQLQTNKAHSVAR